MEKAKYPSFFVIGLALYSMFFGAGNIIFSLYIGQSVQADWVYGAAGFIVSAVLIPLLGVIAMLIYRGDYERFFGTFGKIPAFLVVLTLLTVWIPLGSSPRNVTLSFASLAAQIPMPPFWAFSLIYCVAAGLIVYRKSRMLDVLGYVLTPLLIACLGLIVFVGFCSTPSFLPGPESKTLFLQSLMTGYNTHDLIASFFFSASIIEILRQSSSEKKTLSITFKACLVALVLLALTYIGLIGVAASHPDALAGVKREALLMSLAQNVLGTNLSFVAGLAIILACFTTSVALVTVYTNFLTDKVFNNPHAYTFSLLLTLVSTFALSITGLDGITNLTQPFLEYAYPVLLLLIILKLLAHSFQYLAKTNAQPTRDAEI